MPNALEISQGRQAPLTAGLFQAIQTYVPLFSAFDVRTTADTKVLSLALISLPSAGFADINEGFEASDGHLELREFSCSMIGGLIKAELNTMDLWNKHHQASGYDWWDLQSMLKIRASVMHVEQQIILGSSNDAKGFPGAKELTPWSQGVFTMAQTAAHYDFERPVLNVAGTTANTASSVYSFVFGEMDAQLVFGNDSGGELFSLGEVLSQFFAPDSNAPTKLLEHQVQQMIGYVGLSVGGFNQQVEGQRIPVQYSVRRAANVTADVGRGCTDAVMDKLSRSHGTGRWPSLFAMSHRSGEQLAASRQPTAINYVMGQTGDAASAVYNTYPEPPDNWRGVPIIYPRPQVIGDTDAIEA
jgi:hypothetical protein